jgi:hypothetical protein
MSAHDLEPAIRDEIPDCWTKEARALSGTFIFAERVKPWNWLELDREEAEKLWSLLTSFVTFLNRRYGERPDRRVPPCWAEHGALVEELTTLLFARWHAFESPHGSIGGAQYWHSYTLPSFYERMASWLGDRLLTCQQGRHRDLHDPPLETLSSWAIRTERLRGFDCDRRRHPPTVSRRKGDDVSISVLEVPYVTNREDEAGTSQPRREE